MTAVPNGPRIYRRRLRTLGLIAPLAPAVALLVVARVLLHGSITATVVSVGLTMMALPVLAVLGAPLRGGSSIVVLAVVLSIVLWAVAGAVAARRATRRPAVGWREYWTELAWLASAIWIGLACGVLLVDVILGRPVI